MVDTFKQLTHRIPYPAALVYNALAGIKPVSDPNGYRSEWQKMASETNLLVDHTLSELPFSDALVFKHILELVPENTLLTLGNSSVIRYSQLFPAREKIDYYSNRGVSGIDGCLSAAAGIASNTKQLTVAITGDLGFVYDSNSLWNNSLPRNLRFIVINNQGGGIFHILKGPADQPGFKKLIEANHPVNIHKLAGAFGLKYFFADSLTSLSDCWESFICDQDAPVILEVKTDAATSASTFRKLMSISGLT
jgi:2-succinyl-5-enolpyruvyl-6-hydroxy-3-cyclohexene-1-carboxylate synthase